MKLSNPLENYPGKMRYSDVERKLPVNEGGARKSEAMLDEIAAAVARHTAGGLKPREFVLRVSPLLHAIALVHLVQFPEDPTDPRSKPDINAIYAGDQFLYWRGVKWEIDKHLDRRRWVLERA